MWKFMFEDTNRDSILQDMEDEQRKNNALKALKRDDNAWGRHTSKKAISGQKDDIDKIESQPIKKYMFSKPIRKAPEVQKDTTEEVREAYKTLSAKDTVEKASKEPVENLKLPTKEALEVPKITTFAPKPTIPGMEDYKEEVPKIDEDDDKKEVIKTVIKKSIKPHEVEYDYPKTAAAITAGLGAAYGAKKLYDKYKKK